MIAGALVGSAFLLRTEALVYGAIGASVALVLLYRQRRRLARALRFILEFAAGAAITVGLGSCARAGDGRSAACASLASEPGSAASSAGTVGSPVPGSRVSDAIATTVNLRPSLDLASYAAGAAVVAMIVIIVWGASNGRSSQPREKRVLVGFALLVGGLYVVRVSQGLGFVPGLFAAAPIAAVALALGWAPWKRRVLTAVAVGALPFIWLFQYVGGAAPQWGGRYELPTTMLLVVVGIVALESLPRWIGRSLIAVSVVITSFGVLWLGQRSHSIGDAMAKIDRLQQPVVVSDVAHLFREGGASYDTDRRWLTAVDGAAGPSSGDRAACGLRRVRVHHGRQRVGARLLRLSPRRLPDHRSLQRRAPAGDHVRRRLGSVTAIRRRPALTLIPLALLFLVTGLVEAWRDSPTVDEAIDIAAGVSSVVHHDLRLMPEHGVLVKLLPALPALAAHPAVPDGAGYRSGDWLLHTDEFVRANRANGRLQRVVFLARLVPLLEGLMVAWLLYVLGARLFGAGPGVLASALWLTTPVFVGFSHLAGVDVASTLATLVVSVALLRFLEAPSDRGGLLVGVAIGASLLTRHLALCATAVAPAW